MEKYIFKVNNNDARTTFMEVVCGIFITNFEQYLHVINLLVSYKRNSWKTSDGSCKQWVANVKSFRVLEG